ncbi:hypothetical protein [Streptomyces murinus]|uniref:hypothetical protein n=1 Tax=Streptomyces murinus TaxID=33900 RepID=UPI003819AABF
MRTLTDAECEEVAALIRNRQLRPTMRRLPLDPKARPAGLFEDGILLASMIPRLGTGLGWGRGPCLVLSSVHILPGQSDDILRMITLWASDYAARLGLPVVRTEVWASHAHGIDPVAALLRRFTDMGWDVRGSGPGREGDRVARLELPAEHRSGLSALIDCRVHPRTQGPTP